MSAAFDRQPNGILELADRLEAQGNTDEAERWREAVRRWSAQQADAAATLAGDVCAGCLVGATIAVALFFALPAFGETVARWLS